MNNSKNSKGGIFGVALACCAVSFALTGCGNSNAPALTDADKANFKGSKPPADVWQKIAESRAKFQGANGNAGTPPPGQPTPQ